MRRPKLFSAWLQRVSTDGPADRRRVAMLGLLPSVALLGASRRAQAADAATGLATPPGIHPPLANPPVDYVDVRWFGAMLDGKTDNTKANNDACEYCRQTGLPLLIAPAGAGVNLTGTIDRTGVSLFGRSSGFSFGGKPPVSTVQGLPGQDVFTWAEPDDPRYIRPLAHYIRDLTIIVDDTKDVSSTLNRFGFAGERVGNCAIVYPVSRVPSGGFGEQFAYDNVAIRALTGAGNSSCGIYTQQPHILAHVTNFSTQSVDFGWIDGPPAGRAASFDTARNSVIQPNHGYTQGETVSLLSDDGVFTVTPGGLLSSGKEPSGVYYSVVDPAVNSYRLARANGDAIRIISTGANCGVAPAYRSTIEWAPDNIFMDMVRISANRVGVSWTNWGQGAVAQLSIYPGAVCARFLNFPARARYAGSQGMFRSFGCEGPLGGRGIPDMTGKEYMRIGWHRSEFIGPNVNGNVKGAFIGLWGDENVLDVLGAGVGDDRYVKIYGSRNAIRCYARNEYNAIRDYGSDNTKLFLSRSAGGGTTPFVTRRRDLRDISVSGGFEPDYLDTNPSSFYYNRRSLFIAGANLSPGTGKYRTDYAYDFTDMSSAVPGSLELFYANRPVEFSYWDGRNSAESRMVVGKFIPASKGTLYAMAKASAPCRATLSANGGSFSAVTATMNLDNAWQLFSCRYDAQKAAGSSIAVVVGPPSARANVFINFICFVPDDEKLAVNSGALMLTAATAYSGTLNTGAGTITTDNLSTAAGGRQILTIGNALVEKNDIVMLTRAGGTNSAGAPECEAAAAQAKIVITLKNNAPSAAFNGTFVYNFLVVKAS